MIIMVIKCSGPFIEDDKYSQYFEMFPTIELSLFQKWAFKAIVDGDHTLITAHTGSGKTLPAEFAIQYFVNKGKKVIYTAPIKALSNTKLADFRRKYPEISFGIVTGDITDNPEADVLIMTTEILPNTIMNRKKENAFLSFDMDFENELGVVIFDEVHYINDTDRGHVWEQAILMLPQHVQQIMLSATIDKADIFAEWVEKQKNNQGNIQKKVYLASTNHRVVPLTHYFWTTCHKSAIKSAKGKPIEKIINDFVNKPVVLKESTGEFNEKNYQQAKKINEFLKNSRITRQHVLNGLIRHLHSTGGLPAICFVFSKRQTEVAANEINMCLFDDDDSTPNTIEQECKQILIKKFSNYKEYLNLPEYAKMISLFKRGIGVHHAGVIAVFRELTEILFEQRKLKLLFATETLAVGINFSTSSVIYTGVSKYDGNELRMLAPHEYTQISGRAGRRGIDKVGKVWLCANLLELGLASDYNTMMNGRPQTLTSKFKISFQLVLNLLTHDNPVDFINQSMMTNDIQKEIARCSQKLESLKNDYLIAEKSIEIDKSELALMYARYELILNPVGNINIIKKIKQEFQKLDNTTKQQLQNYCKLIQIKKDITNGEQYLKNTQSYIESNIQRTIDLLTERGFGLNDLGASATQFQEAHPLVVAQLMHENNYFSELSAYEIAALLSCFTDIRLPDQEKTVIPTTTSSNLNAITEQLCNYIIDYNNLENKYQIYTGSIYEYTLDIQQIVLDWCMATTETECQEILNRLPIFTGEFVKAILKINNIALEMEKASIITGQIQLVKKINDIKSHTLKFIVTNQSIYI